MKNSKLLTILKTFSKKEWKAFIKWSRSCYEDGSTGETILKIIANDINLSVIGSNSKLAEQILTNQDVTISERTLANALSQLTEHLELFLTTSEVKKNKQLFDAILLESYAKRGLSSVYYASKHSLKNHSPSLWNNYFKLKVEYNSYFKGFYQNYEESKIGLESLKNTLVKFYNDISDFIILEMENRMIVLGENWKEEINVLKIKYKESSDFTYIFDKIIEMRKHEDENAYYYLRDQLIANLIADEDIVEVLMVHITSYLNLRFKSGEYQLADDVLTFYEIGVRNGYYLTDGKMSPRRFLNIVNTACSLEKQNWAKDFKNDYKHLLESKFEKDIVLLCNAAISFADEDFISVSNILNVNRFKDFDLEYRARLLKLQSHIEIEKENTTYIIDEIKSFKLYIKRNMTQMNEATLKGTQTLLTYIERIVHGKLDHIEEDLAEEKYLMLGKWLNKTIKEKVKKH